MQKIGLLAFSFLIFLLSFSFNSAKTYAATEDLSASSSSKRVNYDLPYPGLLPDSPLYFLRVIRDKIVEFLISDPLKKSEFDLLQANKRLNAGIFLFNKGKMSLALSTISKAENYFLQALDALGKAKEQGRSTDGIEGKLKDALEKHEQELESLTKNSDANLKTDFARELKRVTDFEQRLNR
jgi:hypothetical protein